MELRGKLALLTSVDFVRTLPSKRESELKIVRIFVSMGFLPHMCPLKTFCTQVSGDATSCEADSLLESLADSLSGSQPGGLAGICVWNQMEVKKHFVWNVHLGICPRGTTFAIKACKLH